MPIVATASVSEFFEEALEEAMRARGVAASGGATAYLVGLLVDLAKPGSPVEQTLERSLTLMLDEALHTPELAHRFEKLRTLGDGVLYTSGFFADHFQARGVDTKYVIGIGRTAYESAGSLLVPTSSPSLEEQASSPKGTHIFKELSARFAEFVAVLGEVANATLARGAATSRGLLTLYERWLKTRSESLADALGAHGFVAPRGGGGRVLS